MFPYWLLFTICAAGALEYRRRPWLQMQGGPLLLVAGLLATVLIGLRFDVGGDWETYILLFDIFRYSEAGELISGSDPGYSTLNWLAHQLGFGFWLVNLVCAVIFTWGLMKFARQQPNPWLVMVVAVPYLVIVVAMGYTRQAVAIGFILAGLASRRGGSIAWFAFYVALAATFHKTAVIVLPLIGLATTRHRVLTAGTMLVMFVMLYYLFVYGAVDRLVNNYEAANYDSQGAAIRVTMNVLPATVFLLLHKRFALPEDEAKLWRIFSYSAFGTLLMLAVLSSSTLVDRLALYLIPLQLFVLSRLPHALGTSGQANGAVALAVVAYSGLVQFVWLNFAGNAPAWVPYHFYPWVEQPVG